MIITIDTATISDSLRIKLLEELYAYEIATKGHKDVNYEDDRTIDR